MCQSFLGHSCSLSGMGNNHSLSIFYRSTYNLSNIHTKHIQPISHTHCTPPAWQSLGGKTCIVSIIHWNFTQPEIYPQEMHIAKTQIPPGMHRSPRRAHMPVSKDKPTDFAQRGSLGTLRPQVPRHSWGYGPLGFHLDPELNPVP